MWEKDEVWKNDLLLTYFSLEVVYIPREDKNRFRNVF